MWYSEYGCPKDPGELPVREYRAHMAILEGVAEKREKENKRLEREQRKAQNQT